MKDNERSREVIAALEALGCQARLVDVARLPELKEDIARFAARDDLNGFQRWIVSNLYSLEPENCDFTPRSVLIYAAPHPLWVKVTLRYQGKEIRCRALPGADIPKADAAIRRLARVCPAQRLPMKWLATRSGLAEYGRSNVTFVPGMGSALAYDAYFTDLEPLEDTWGEARVSANCEGCDICVGACPTGAILPERFLIDNGLCLSCHNEQPGELPAFIPKGVHHTFYDCLRCQECCPMNAGRLDDIPEETLDEAECELLLAGTPLDKLPEKLLAKVRYFELDRWYNVIPRNLRLLIEQGGE